MIVRFSMINGFSYRNPLVSAGGCLPSRSSGDEILVDLLEREPGSLWDEEKGENQHQESNACRFVS